MLPTRTLGVLALVLAAPAAASPPASDVPTAARYIVVEQDAAGNLTPVWEKRVRLELPAATPAGIAAAAGGGPDGGEPAIEATVVDAGGGVRYREVVRPTAWLRGEFATGHGAVSPIEGHFVPRDISHFVVRVPEIAGARLVLRRPGGAVTEVPAAPPAASAELDAVTATSIVAAIQNSGSPANRLDLLIVGEGYTASQYSKFLADVNALLASFFAATPYAEYQGFLNIAALYVTSQQEGADHPAYRSDCLPGDPTCCSDTTAVADPLAGRLVDTAFDAQFCTLGIQRLLTVDDRKVLAAAAAVPDWDTVIVLVNDSTYGGSGGQVAVISTNSRATEVAQHELGHSFSLLADEYETAYPGYPGCSDVVSSASCEANVTDETVRDRIKWAPWIHPDTPLPTSPADPAFAGVVGLFEGARYRSTGIYRPRRQCLMRELGRSFCEVCRQEFVLRLYRGGWGVPAAGIDPVDPGGESPPPGPIGVSIGNTLHFWVRLVRPAATPSLAVSWLIDGEPVAGADGEHLAWAPPHPGSFHVEIAVHDATGFLHEELAAPASRRQWEVTVWSGRHPRRRVPAGASAP